MKNISHERYIKSVIKNISCNTKTRKKIQEDLLNHIQVKSLETGEEDPWKLMGDPYEVAKEFRENIGSKCDYGDYYSPYEYKSETKIFGIPLVHINNRRNGVAKGIIAIGGISIGVLSLGGISIGLISFGGASIGLLIALGGLAGSLGFAAGGAAFGYYMAIGGFAIAQHFAMGGYAQANVAIGDVAKGIISVFKTKGTGDILLKAPVESQEFVNSVRNLYPNIDRVTLKILSFFAEHMTI